MSDDLTTPATADSYLSSQEGNTKGPWKQYTRHVFQCWDDMLGVSNECGQIGWRIIHIHDDAERADGKYRVITVIFERTVVG